MNTITLRSGEEFLVPADWAKYLRDVFARNDWLPYCGVNPKYSTAGIEQLMPRLYEELKVLGMEKLLLDGAFELMERATTEEMRSAFGAVPFQDAPNALDRLYRIWEMRHEDMDTTTHFRILRYMLELAPKDGRALEALRGALTQYPDNAGFQQLAKRFLPPSTPYR